MAIVYAPGLYAGTVTEQAFTRTKKGDKHMIVFKVRIDSKLVEEANEAGEIEEKAYTTEVSEPRTLRLVIDPADESSLDYAMTKLRYMGFQGTSMDEFNMVGQRIRALCAQGEYNGEPKEDWNLPLPPRKFENDPSVAKELNNLFGRGRLANDATNATPKGSGGATATATAEREPGADPPIFPDGDDEPPF